jgi:two-component sensor histidine kinase/HAMP domain-containing protein
MRIQRKIHLGYLGIAIMVAIVGLFGLIAARLIVEGFEGNEEQLNRMVTAGTEMSSYSKRAEGHLLLFLTLHDKVDRDKFLKRCESVREQIAILEGLDVSGDTGILLSKARSDIQTMVDTGTALIEAHDREMSARGQMDLRDYSDLVLKLYSAAKDIRIAGIDIVGIATDSLNKQEAITAALEIQSYAKRVESHLMLYLVLNKPVDRDKYLKRHASLVEDLNVLKERLEESSDRRLLEKAYSEAAELKLVGDTLLNASDARGGFKGGLGLEEHKDKLMKVNELSSSIRRVGVSLAQSQSDLVYSRKLAARSKALRLQAAIIAIVVLSFIVVIVAGYLFSHAITGPLKALQEAAGRIGEGDLDTEVELKGNDEIRWLSDAFAGMVSNLKLTTMSRDHFDSINNSMNDSLVVVSTDGTISYANKATREMLGYGRGRMLVVFTAEDTGEGSTQNMEMKYLTAGGAEVPVSCSAGSLAGKKGQLQGLVFSAQDITESKAVREELERTLEEREVLLREIHHRVKNNMTLVTSLLSLQADCLDDESQSAAFDDLINRIRTMSLVHERRYKSEDFVSLDIKGYFRALIDDLYVSLKRPGLDVAITLEIGEVHLDMDNLMYLGLIVNELVTNAFKHAFNGDGVGEVIISLSAEDDTVTLTVSDNGKGFPEAGDGGERGRKLGMRLVKTLVNQIDGELHIARERGVRARITFKASQQ